MSVFAWLLIIHGLNLRISFTHSANHYCVNGLTTSLALDDFYHRDETIIFSEVNQPLLLRLEPMRCRWEVTLTSSRPDVQRAVFERLPADQRAIDVANKNETDALTVKLEGDSVSFSLPEGVFQVDAIKHRKQFNIIGYWNAGTQKMKSAKLRILIPLPKICGRHMLSYRGSCYAVSSVRQNVTDAIRSIRGDAQLASFTSLAQLRGFVAANNDKLSQFPYRRPLSLDQPVRLGKLLNAADSTVLSVVRNDSGCDLQPVVNSAEFTGLISAQKPTGPCVSLRLVEPYKPLIEFVNCSQPMLSLMSFPEVVSSESRFEHSCNISETVMHHVIQFSILDFDNQVYFGNSSYNGTVNSFDDGILPLGVHIQSLIYLLLSMGIIGIVLLVIGKFCSEGGTHSDYLNVSMI